MTNGFSSSIDYAESREWFLTPFSDRPDFSCLCWSNPFIGISVFVI